ncbi:hypothetical protein GZH47_08985 [Paenibacillus rhizovicinus]|uniref:Lipoprotein n=1 Tax=Paenibacillus rhizovicinus TaxID=2704463 RepID=A0A6C0P2T8_9BACL|nr:hypothetical protein [Paenibacillus rhizovicinus]QHW30972.1 hypothetical protein GZH47_08985 [Paenibacillus rhizovicinus]
MKAIYILVFLVLSMTLASGCSNVNSKSDDLNAIREVALNSISNQDKQQLNLVWKNAEVTKIKFDEMINEYSIPEGAEPKRIENLYKVTFDKNHVIFVDGNTKKVVGTISKE